MLKKEEKLKLFKDILLDIGIGAKTNVGYGQFSREYTNAKFSKYIENLENVEKEKINRENEEKLKELKGFEKIKFKYLNTDKINGEKEHDLKEIFEKIDEFEEVLAVANFLKKEYEILGKWSGKQSKKQKNKIKKINEIIDKN
jgi:CRISPR-associated protein Cmr6